MLDGPCDSFEAHKMNDDLMPFLWNEADLGSNHNLNDGLISLLAFDAAGDPHQIGTGFVVEARDSKATVITAAHNLTGWPAAGSVDRRLS
jgi:hypothetical protein